MTHFAIALVVAGIAITIGLIVGAGIDRFTRP